MARITIEDCLDKVPNRFALVRLASKRARQLREGEGASIEVRKNKECVTALREAAHGHLRFTEAVGPAIERRER